MGENGDGRTGRGGASLDAVLREVLRGGRLDPGAERLAAQGVERLRTFLAGDPSVNLGKGAPGPAGGAGERLGEQVGDAVDAEVVEEEAPAAEAGRTLRHAIPLRGGRLAEVLVPEHLTAADARRIAAVLEALALDEEEGAGA
ncbi:hypothetical protein [Kineococcus indalonis]|uniref:hypothetical protein n=1 Tax=Kineococcus indalonis TaxID=2696566 RepID=UPI0014128191|nr:hypothetical protein [Kineococcus indalonis]NAZ87528.1 hypothetical protein [Kineococcus indalonis]